MAKTFIIVIIILAVLAYIWYNQTHNTETFASVSDTNNQVLPALSKLQDVKYQNTNNISSNEYPQNYNVNQMITDLDSCDDSENSNDYSNDFESDDVRENENGLVINDSVVSYDENTQDSDDQIRKKFITRNHPRKSGNKRVNYSQGERGGIHGQAMDYLDASNDLMQTGYSVNDKFTGNDISNSQYAAYEPERKHTNKFKTSEIFNSQNYLPDKKTENPEWFDTIPDAISVKNRHLINVSKPIGINTIGTSLRNPNYDIRGSEPNPKFVISPWMQSTIEPDNNLKSWH